MRYAAVGEASFLPVAVADEGTPATDLGPVDQAEAGIDSGAEGTLAMVRPDDLTFRPEERGDAEILSAGYQGVGWLSTVGLPSGHVLAVAEDPPRRVRGRHQGDGHDDTRPLTGPRARRLTGRPALPGM